MWDRRQAQQAKAHLDDFKIQLATLRATMANVEKQIVDMTNSLAPVSSIPNEILATIFKEVSTSDDYLRGDGPHVPRSKLPSLMLVSHVSRRFRNVGIGTPSLWTNVHLHLSSILDIR